MDMLSKSFAIVGTTITSILIVDLNLINYISGAFVKLTCLSNNK